MEPPYHTPVFVVTHHPRPSIEMDGDTVFHFVTAGIGAALDQARSAAGGRDVKIGGGVSTVRQFLQAGLIDELHLAISPVVLGQGEALLTGIDLPGIGFRVTEHVATERLPPMSCSVGRRGAPVGSTKDARREERSQPREPEWTARWSNSVDEPSVPNVLDLLAEMLLAPDRTSASIWSQR